MNYSRLLVVPAFVVAVAAAIATPGTAAEPFSIESVLSAPFPSNLVVAPSAPRFAWVFNHEGRRNVWAAEAPGFESRPLTAFPDDDGQEIGSLAWAPDASFLVFVRGGAKNRAGEFPNPLSVASGVDRSIWIARWPSGEARRVTAGSSPLVSADCRSIIYLNGGIVRRISIDTELNGDAAESDTLLEARGSIGSLRLSPAGGKLAFVSSRGDHSFVGVLDLESRAIRWLDPGVDHDQSPVWSPDSARVAFLRIPYDSDPLLFNPRRDGLPWSIRVADVTSGVGREIFRADDGVGSVFRAVVSRDQLFWSRGDRIVFPWERDGWTHLYSVTAAGQVVQLTEGKFEVEHVRLGPKRRWIYFDSNRDDTNRRHLARVRTNGKRLQSLSSGQGIEWSPTPLPTSKFLALLRSSSSEPACVARMRLGKQSRITDLDIDVPRAEFPGDDFVEPQAVVFSAADGMPIHGQLFLPPDAEKRADSRKPDRHPAVLFFHGGSRRQMLLGFHYSDYYHKAYALNQYLASRGFVVLSVNYRSGIGYGMRFREALQYGATGASEFHDVMGAGLYLRSRDDVDPQRIGLWGGSYGGYLTALGLARASDLFAAGVDIHGVHDWNVVINNFRPGYDPLEHPEAARLAFTSSPLADVATWRSPVLLIHGDDDRNVPFSETVRLVEALRKQGVQHEILTFPDDVHSFLTHENYLRAYRATADFLVRHLAEDAGGDLQSDP